MPHKRAYYRAAAFLCIMLTLIFSGITPKAEAANSPTAGQITAPGFLNVRNSAGATGGILTSLPAGSYVTLLSKTDNWWYVEYAPSSYGYASATYIQNVSGAHVTTVSSSVAMLNVRTGPGSSYQIAGTVSSGQTVLVLSENNGWDKILYNGTLTGYASAAYLKTAMVWPVPASRTINQYMSETHNGIDIGASVRGVSGDRVVAASGGQVVYAGTLSGYGNVVYINSVYNGQLIQTRYGHLKSTPVVSAGTTVSAGQLIGYMGNTGTSSGVHLHFEVRIRNSGYDCLANVDSMPVNPLSYI